MTGSATPAMIAAARRAMEAALDLTDRDRVLVVGDASRGACPAAFAAAAGEVGCEVATYDLPEDGHPLTAMPDGMAELLEDITVVINAIDGRSDEVPFRLEWIGAVENAGRIRMGHCPGITEAMMTGGSLDVDYGRMAAREQTLLRLLRDAESLRITAPGGTDLVLSIAGRTFVSDLKATVEVGVNLPCGEVYCAPVEDGADGVLVVDGPIGGDGNAPEPVRLTIAGGRVTEVTCGDAGWRERIQRYMDADAQSNAICELGIGLNAGARLVGNMLEDEKALRTAHIAFGDNQGMPGGRSVSCMHIDYLFHRPTITVLGPGGAETPVLVDGDLVE